MEKSSNENVEMSKLVFFFVETEMHWENTKKTQKKLYFHNILICYFVF